MPAAGPLGKLVIADSTRVRPTAGYPMQESEFRADASALIMMRRIAFFNKNTGRLDADGHRVLLHWAAETGLGQDDGFVRQVADKRAAAVRQLRAHGQHVVRLTAVPEWRLAVGLGDKANPHEIGLSLHGTYGWPVIPGSSLKGLTVAWASDSDVADPALVRRIFGTPRPRPAAPPASATPSEPDARGTVRFLDAIPAGGPDQVKVTVDVLTPHVKRYYESTGRNAQGPAEPPAEYHSPVPVTFLTVRGPFTVDLYGPDADDVDRAACWLIKAGDGLGAGAKTAAGYGYLSITRLSEDE